jgi:hypothetical protein
MDGGGARFAALAAVMAALLAACGGDGGSTAGLDAARPDAAADHPPLDGAAATGCEVLGASVGQVAYSTDGRWLAAAHADGRVTVVELGGTAVRTLKVSERSLPRIALTEDGGLLVAAVEGAVKVWSAAEGTLVRALASGTGPSVSVKLSDSPAPFLLVSFDRASTPADNVKVWRLADGILVGLASGGPLATFTHADAAVLLLDEERGGFDVLTFGGKLIRHVTFPEPLGKTAFASDGAFMAGVTGAGSTDERLATLSVGDDGFVWKLAEGTAGTRQLLFLENPSRVVQFARQVVVHDHADGKALLALAALEGATGAAAGPDGATIAALTPAGGVVLVSSSDGRRLACQGPRP